MSWTYSRALTIDHTKVPNTDQANFPVKVAGTVATLKTVGNGGHVQHASGYDIAFFSDAGLTTMLKFERVVWVPSSGKHVFFVKIPTLSHSADTVIYMAYGNASISTDQQDAANTWDANFKAVYHLGDGTTLSLADSTSNAVGLTNTGTVTATAGPDGQGAGSFNGSSQDLETTAAVATTEPLTIEALFNPPDNTLSGDLACVGNSANTSSTRTLIKRLTNVVRVGHFGTATVQTDSGAAAYATSAWNYAAATFTSITARDISPNGATKTSSSTTVTSIGAANRAAIGCRFQNATRNNFFTGSISEVRFSSVVRSDDWIKATYNNLIGLSTFYTLGSESGSNNAPTASISAPTTGASYASGASVAFAGTGSDVEDGTLTGSSLTWTSSRDGAIGTGTSFSTTTLSVGTHTITLTATDSLGATGTSSITVTITSGATLFARPWLYAN